MKIPENNSDDWNQAPDGMLIQAWKTGNQDAAEIIFRRYAMRLTALVAKRMHRQIRSTTSPDDVVQSALGSFFVAAQQSRIQVSQSVSLWRLLATFAKRKLVRVIERQTAVKRGGDKGQSISLEHLDQLCSTNNQTSRIRGDNVSMATATGATGTEQAWDVDEILEDLFTHIPSELKNTFEYLVAGASIQEIATVAKVSTRTISRQVARIRDIIQKTTELGRSISSSADPAGQRPGVSPSDKSKFSFHSDALPQWHYCDFVLGKMVGSGGFGKVYRAAQQSHPQATVAVKFLRKSFWQNFRAKRMLMTEIEQAAKIDHPSVVKYLGWGESPQGGPFLVMQWVENGQPLASQPQDLTPIEFSRYLIGVCQTMAHVHDCRVVHGDLSPHNILINSSGDHWISDFGFSHQTSSQAGETDASADQPTRNQSRQDSFFRGGTMGFAAPEQIDSAWGEVGPWTDIYAIGGLAYWYLTGQSPHQSGTAAETLLNTLQPGDVPIPNPEIDSAMLPKIADVARQSLKKTIAQRPDSIFNLVKVLS